MTRPDSAAPLQNIPVTDNRIFYSTRGEISLSGDAGPTIQRRKFIEQIAIASLGFTLTQSFTTKKELFKSGRVGMIGLDTSHCEAFTKILNDPSAPPEYEGFRVTAAYPYGSKTIKSSTDRIPEITAAIKKYNVLITDSIDELLNQVDVVLLETNDGRLHHGQALQVMKAGKRLFIDKPVAASFKDAIAIYEAAKKYNVPVFSSSSLRFTPIVQDIAQGKTIGKVLGVDTYTPCVIEQTHPDFFWYGIHGIEVLYTILGSNCKQVVCTHTTDTDIVTGIWEDERVGSFRGTRTGEHNYGGTAFGEKGNIHFSAYAGYEPLVKEIVRFFRTGISPVSPEQTIEICAFMEAAEESKRKGGTPVELKKILK